MNRFSHYIEQEIFGFSQSTLRENPFLFYQSFATLELEFYIMIEYLNIIQIVVLSANIPHYSKSIFFIYFIHFDFVEFYDIVFRHCN